MLNRIPERTSVRRNKAHEIAGVGFIKNLKMKGNYFLLFALIILGSAIAVKAQSKKWKDGILKDEFIYEKAPFPSCHSATIAEAPVS